MVTPSQAVPPEDQEGTEAPDYPGTPSRRRDSTEPVETPGHKGTDPVPTPGAGRVAVTA